MPRPARGDRILRCMTSTGRDVVQQTFPLGPQWPTIDPFLFVAHHLDVYPKANDRFGPDATLDGRQVGQDFAGIDGWNMYHGSVVPGFPQHPHRGFETVTYVRHGLIDHADSLGATARFGRGDTQWMTAGSGIQHAEMFPLLDRSNPNPLEMFQIWLNLPAANKMVDPYFTMLWSDTIPRLTMTDTDGRTCEITVVAGSLAGAEPASPPPDSWAAKSDAEVAIWHLSFEPHATWVMPAALGETTGRTLYAFEGSSVSITDIGDHGKPSCPATYLDAGTGAIVDATTDLRLTAGNDGVECVVLQGRPIAEPVVQHGPFVMNTRAEINQAFDDYQRTGFGGWPWPDSAPNHGADAGRFAIHSDGRRQAVSPNSP